MSWWEVLNESWSSVIKLDSTYNTGNKLQASLLSFVKTWRGHHIFWPPHSEVKSRPLRQHSRDFVFGGVYILWSAAYQGETTWTLWPYLWFKESICAGGLCGLHFATSSSVWNFLFLREGMCIDEGVWGGTFFGQPIWLVCREIRL